MADQSRIEDLRRRIQRDPASIAFAQLAEEYRRSHQYSEAVDTCRAGLALHPGYLSARVTLGRSLIELGVLDEAQHELEVVLKSAPENLAALRGIAEIHHRQGELEKALEYFSAALALARNDPDLEETVADLTRRLAPRRGPDPADGLSLEQMTSALAVHLPPAPAAPPSAAAPPSSAKTDHEVHAHAEHTDPAPVALALPAVPESSAAQVPPAESAAPVEARESAVSAASVEFALSTEPAPPAEPALSSEPAAPARAAEPDPSFASPQVGDTLAEMTGTEHPGNDHVSSLQTLAQLEAFLQAIHAVRAERRA